MIEQVVLVMATNVVCKTCGLMQQVEKLEPGTRAECCRCMSIIGSRKINSLGRTAAFLSTVNSWVVGVGPG
jgi:uncharacterized paraquat-inducible protein A